MGRPKLPLDERLCEHCGAPFAVERYKRNRFCTRSCAVTATSSLGDVRGPKNNRYNGGLCFHRGRWIVCCRDGTLTWYSRAVMAAHVGRLLTSAEIVHHINGDPSDDRIENLQVVTRAEHMAIHRAELEPKRLAALSAGKAWDTRRERKAA